MNRALALDLDAARRARQERPATPGSIQDALQRSRVDVMALLDHGIPEREWVPGAEGLIPKGKRLHIAASAKSGKSLALAVVTAIDIIEAGGTVAILDRENGADEYARRLLDVLDVRCAGDDLRLAVRQRLHYYAWPVMSLDWRDDPDYPVAFAGVDVVIFDSTRSHTGPLALKEDSSDDWSLFMSSLVDPLMRAGIATITLDNTGHDGDRPRGTKSKLDLGEIVFMATGKPFSRERAGSFSLVCSHSRIGEITTGDTWRMELGGGKFGSWERNDRNAANSSSPRPEGVMQAISEAVERQSGMGTKDIYGAVKGSTAEKKLALELLIEEECVKRLPKGKQAHEHHHIKPYRSDRSKPFQTTSEERAEPTVPTMPLPVGGGMSAGTVGGNAESGNRSEWNEGESEALA
jgi:hypothetical protein